MAFKPIVLNRQQLAQFLPSPEAIKAFEQLFQVSLIVNPDSIEENSIDVNSKISLIYDVISSLNDFSQSVEIVAGNADAKANQISDEFASYKTSLELAITEVKQIATAAAAPSPPGSVSFTAATITGIAYGKQYATAIVVDAAINALSKIMIAWGNFTDADENTPDMDLVQFNAIPDAGFMTVRLSCTEPYARLGGSYKINYLIG